MKKFKRLVSLFHHLRHAYWEWQHGEESTEWDMTRYSRTDENDKNAWHPRIIKIVVADQQTKDEMIVASRYVHDRDIDTDFMVVNTMAHLYQRPELIIVKELDHESDQCAAKQTCQTA